MESSHPISEDAHRRVPARPEAGDLALMVNDPSPLRAVVSRVHHRLAGTERNRQLPSAVRSIIARQQAHSEIVIGWVQLAIVLTFAILYALSPTQIDPALDFAPVPFALAAYFAFTTLRLALAHLRKLPTWFLYLSVVLDIGLLLGLIWTFHIQYAQPASFYLKVPTLLYLFIFIALRALRFEASYVIFAGLTGAVGWLAMVWYATSVDPADSMITRDYVQYMTSNSVLLGAEFDKIISILIVTAILALGLTRAQRLVVHAAMERTRARTLSRFVPDEVAAGAVDPTSQIYAPQGETGEATMLFIDLEGFTALSERLAPADLIDTLNDYFAAMAVPLARHDGVITQFQGDAILASFNVPRAHADHAHRAVSAGLEMLEILGERRFGAGDHQLRARIGINTGNVTGGLVGTPDRVGYTVHGDAVNLAARLESMNKEFATSILVSERTRVSIDDPSLEFRDRGTVSVRGLSEEVRLYEVAKGPGSTRADDSV